MGSVVEMIESVHLRQDQYNFSKLKDMSLHLKGSTKDNKVGP